MKEKTRYLRKNQTDAEKLLWRHLRNRQIANSKFRRQHEIGSYIVDFICIEQLLIIEIDGGQHAEQITYDAKRTAYLETQGYNVIRFWNNDVINDMDAVLNKIYEILLNQPSPS